MAIFVSRPQSYRKLQDDIPKDELLNLPLAPRLKICLELQTYVTPWRKKWNSFFILWDFRSKESKFYKEKYFFYYEGNAVVSIFIETIKTFSSSIKKV